MELFLARRLSGVLEIIISWYLAGLSLGVVLSATVSAVAGIAFRILKVS